MTIVLHWGERSHTPILASKGPRGTKETVLNARK